MATANRIRWGALAAFMSGLLYFVGMPGAAEVSPVVSHVAGHALFALAGLLSLFGLKDLLSYDAGRSGKLGKTGMVIGMMGAALLSIGNGAEAILVIHESFSWTSQIYSLGLLGVVIGLVLSGLGTRRGKVLPRWTTLTLIVAPLAFFLIFVFALSVLVATGNTGQSAAQGNVSLTLTNYVIAVLFGIPWLALGFALWSGKGVTESKGTKRPHAVLQ